MSRSPLNSESPKYLIQVNFVDSDSKLIPETKMRVPLASPDCTVRQFAFDCLERLARRFRNSIRDYVVADVLVGSIALFYADKLLDVIDHRTEAVSLKLESPTVGAVRKIAHVQYLSSHRNIDEQSVDLVEAPPPAGAGEARVVDGKTLEEMNFFASGSATAVPVPHRERSNDVAPTPMVQSRNSHSTAKKEQNVQPATPPKQTTFTSKNEDAGVRASANGSGRNMASKTIATRQAEGMRDLATTPVNLSKLNEEKRQNFLRTNGMKGWGTEAHRLYPANYDSNGGAKKRPAKRPRGADRPPTGQQPVARELFNVEMEPEAMAELPVENTRTHKGKAFLPFGQRAHAQFSEFWCSDPNDAKKNPALLEKILNAPRSPRKTRAKVFTDVYSDGWKKP